MDEKDRIIAEQAAEIARLRGEKPIPAHLADDVARIKQAGLPVNEAVGIAQRQIEADAQARAEAARKESVAREALKKILAAADGLAAMVRDAVSTTN